MRSRSPLTIEHTLLKICVLCLSILSHTTLTAIAAEAKMNQIEPFSNGPYSTASTNLEIASQFSDMTSDDMHKVLLGMPSKDGKARYLKDLLKYPKGIWNTDVIVPVGKSIYGIARGKTLAITSFIVYPSALGSAKRPYTFPYFDGQFGTFEHMLGSSETPKFEDSSKRYPLIILAHGASSHGIYDIPHAQLLASHGYIVAVPFYGDDRTNMPNQSNIHVGYLRPLITQAVVDSLLASEEFGENIDAQNIGISGHSFGGFTALAIAGGRIKDSDQSISDKRIKAAVIAAPWVGHDDDGGNKQFAFGENNQGLNPVTTPILCLFGSIDKSTPASYILPATKQLSGNRYIVELINQPHIFDQGGWQDRNNWELLFFSAYLKNESASIEALNNGLSMKGGSEDKQLFDYQVLSKYP
jgi:dienelactone hydrolase